MVERKTKKKCGLSVVIDRTAYGYIAYITMGRRVVSATGDTEAEAVKKVIALNYKAISEEIRRMQGHRCHNCGKLGPLEIHHILPRSKGRDDRIENLVGLCHECHTIFHRDRACGRHPVQEEPVSHDSQGRA